MSRYSINIEENMGRLSIIFYRDEKDKNPIIFSRSTALPEYSLIRKKLLVQGLREVAKKLEEEV